MRDPVAVGVVVLATITTGWLVYYVRVFLPAQFDERMRATMKAFSTAIELRFPSHAGLSSRVVLLSLVVGRKLGLTRESLRDLEMSARLRDVGLCALRYRLINGRPMNQWTPAEQLTYDRHPEVSGAMLQLVPHLAHLAPIVRLHHANFDGTLGAEYVGTRPPVVGQSPVRGEAIPIEARILKVVTEYVWLERHNGDAATREFMRAQRGLAYCPEVLDTFLAVLTSTRADEPARAVAV